jgi:hypothetical protein
MNETSDLLETQYWGEKHMTAKRSLIVSLSDLAAEADQNEADSPLAVLPIRKAGRVPAPTTDIARVLGLVQ